jgi:hypothetical protein
MENVTFSEVKRAHGLLRFLWPVQSWGQAKAMALVYAVGLPVMAYVVYLNDADAMWWTLIGGALGGTGGLFIHLPATLELTTRSEARYYIADVSDMLRRLNYADGERCGSNLNFTQRRLSWMRWLPRYLSWKETDIDLFAQDHTITLRGPKFMLNIVKHRGERDVLRSAYRS